MRLEHTHKQHYHDPSSMSVSDLCLCDCHVCACLPVCMFICMRFYALGSAASLSGLTSRWIAWEQEKYLPFLSFPVYLSIHTSGFYWPFFPQKLHNPLLEVWAEGKGCKGSGGWRQDTDLNCDDSLGFLPLTSSTLAGGGEIAATESKLKDSRRFRQCHKQSLQTWVRSTL